MHGGVINGSFHLSRQADGIIHRVAIFLAGRGTDGGR
jgi:hypothetical protein